MTKLTTNFIGLVRRGVTPFGSMAFAQSGVRAAARSRTRS